MARLQIFTPAVISFFRSETSLRTKNTKDEHSPAYAGISSLFFFFFFLVFQSVRAIKYSNRIYELQRTRVRESSTIAIINHRLACARIINYLFSSFFFFFSPEYSRSAAFAKTYSLLALCKAITIPSALGNSVLLPACGFQMNTQYADSVAATADTEIKQAITVSILMILIC